MAEHTNKEINAAIQYAIENGWKFNSSKGHPFGRLRCGSSDEEHKTHQMSVWSTPKNPENHAKQIIRKVDSCKPM
ncbi:ribulose bisphosphate carboxylase small subunit [Shewanella sp. 1180_01]